MGGILPACPKVTRRAFLYVFSVDLAERQARAYAVPEAEQPVAALAIFSEEAAAARLQQSRP
jgi:hypothetical protein